MKWRGWKRAVSRFGLEATASLIDVGDGANLVERAGLIETALLSMPERPTALICTGDESALCVLGKLQARGWKIPEDFSLVGYDGISFGAHSHPALTTVDQPVEEIARAGVDRLLNILGQRVQESIPSQQMIAPRLLVRGSTGPVQSPA